MLTCTTIFGYIYSLLLSVLPMHFKFLISWAHIIHIYKVKVIGTKTKPVGVRPPPRFSLR
jgi:hypothetical protein